MKQRGWTGKGSWLWSSPLLDDYRMPNVTRIRDGGTDWPWCRAKDTRLNEARGGPGKSGKGGMHRIKRYNTMYKIFKDLLYVKKICAGIEIYLPHSVFKSCDRPCGTRARVELVKKAQYRIPGSRESTKQDVRHYLNTHRTAQPWPMMEPYRKYVESPILRRGSQWPLP